MNANVSMDAEDEAAPAEVGIEERIDGEATESSDYLEVNASSDEEPPELEERPVSALG